MALPTSGKDPHRVFTTAERFRMAYSVLCEAREKEMPYAVSAELYAPSRVCGAFATELYLKCLLQVHGLNVPRSHDLALIFSNLSASTKSQLAALWSANGNAGTLDGILAASPLAFEDWRYIYESATLASVYPEFGAVHQVLREFILGLHPDWQRDEPQFRLPTSQAR